MSTCSFNDAQGCFHNFGTNAVAVITWIAATSLLAGFLVVWGLVELAAITASSYGSRAANQQPNSAQPLDVNVTGQQWIWTFEYPKGQQGIDGAIKSDRLVVPLGVPVYFNVTSKDVVHSFWVVELGVKIDANPGAVTNTGFTATKTGIYNVRCAELCGLHHAYMQTQVLWYESLRIGMSGGEIHKRVMQRLAYAPFKPSLNPGHLGSIDEWSHTPIRPDSDDPIRSGMLLQCDIIPDTTPVGTALNCEDTVVIADANLRAQIASHSPELWQVIKARRDYMRTALGIILPEEVLPMSLANARYAPAWLQPDMVWVKE
ncbi:MAG: hypothetical protein EBS29_11200 [Chloroflexia bacterium]|nr:hypothetical protein [Chloroflexia bacterium]